jgi:malate dehydrogenase (oxaloacetate-decarboxylating)(NADP+)
MQMYQTIAHTSLRGFAVSDSPWLNSRNGPRNGEREELCLVKLFSGTEEDGDREIQCVLGHLKEKPNDLERYLYLIRLHDRNERLCYQVLMSDPIRFLLPSNSRRNLLEIFQLPA